VIAVSVADEVVAAGKAPAGASKVRYIVLGLCFLGLTMNYLDRANLSVALPYMDKDLHLNLSNTEKGLILGAFFWAYDGLMLVAGWFTDKIGSRRAFSFAAMWWSLFTDAAGHQLCGPVQRPVPAWSGGGASLSEFDQGSFTLVSPDRAGFCDSGD
jgi:MFS family permease